jgi:hypothetical protein
MWEKIKEFLILVIYLIKNGNLLSLICRFPELIGVENVIPVSNIESHLLFTTFGLCMSNVTREFPYWKTIYHYFCLWRIDGIWGNINAALRTELRIAYGKKLESGAAVLDSQLFKAKQTPRVRCLMLPGKSKGECAIFWWIQ